MSQPQTISSTAAMDTLSQQASAKQSRRSLGSDSIPAKRLLRFTFGHGGSRPEKHDLTPTPPTPTIECINVDDHLPRPPHAHTSSTFHTRSRSDSSVISLNSTKAPTTLTNSSGFTQEYDSPFYFSSNNNNNNNNNNSARCCSLTSYTPSTSLDHRSMTRTRRQQRLQNLGRSHVNSSSTTCLEACVRRPRSSSTLSIPPPPKSDFLSQSPRAAEITRPRPTVNTTTATTLSSSASMARIHPQTLLSPSLCSPWSPSMLSSPSSSLSTPLSPHSIELTGLEADRDEEEEETFSLRRILSQGPFSPTRATSPMPCSTSCCSSSMTSSSSSSFAYDNDNSSFYSETTMVDHDIFYARNGGTTPTPNDLPMTMTMTTTSTANTTDSLRNKKYKKKCPTLNLFNFMLKK